MNEKEILSVSLVSLLKIYPLQPGDIYYDGCLMGYREALERETAIMDLFRFPTRIDAFGVVFCSKGSATVTADLKHCVIGGQTMFVCPPGTIIQVESQQQAAVRFILCEEDFINRIRIDLKLLLHLFMAVRENPTLTLDDREWAEIMRSLDETFAEGRLGRTDALSEEIRLSMFRTLAYRICRIIDNRIERRADGSRTDNASHNRNAAYFNTFLEELSKHYLQERSVGFYAEQLHLTPQVPDDAAALDNGTHGIGMDRRICNSGGEESAEILDDEHPGDRLLPELPEPVLLRPLLQAAHRHDPLGLPQQQMTGAGATRHSFRHFNRKARSPQAAPGRDSKRTVFRSRMPASGQSGWRGGED